MAETTIRIVSSEQGCDAIDNIFKAFPHHKCEITFRILSPDGSTYVTCNVEGNTA